MKGLLALYLILLLVFPGCMMAPMALIPLFTQNAQSRPQPQPQGQPQVQGQPQAQPPTGSTGTQAKEPGKPGAAEARRNEQQTLKPIGQRDPLPQPNK
jgi:hypothetical protein